MTTNLQDAPLDAPARASLARAKPGTRRARCARQPPPPAYRQPNPGTSRRQGKTVARSDYGAIMQARPARLCISRHDPALTAAIVEPQPPRAPALTATPQLPAGNSEHEARAPAPHGQRRHAKVTVRRDASVSGTAPTAARGSARRPVPAVHRRWRPNLALIGLPDSNR